jgi:hypothetical protein
VGTTIFSTKLFYKSLIKIGRKVRIDEGLLEERDGLNEVKTSNSWRSASLDFTPVPQN